MVFVETIRPTISEWEGVLQVSYSLQVRTLHHFHPARGARSRCTALGVTVLVSSELRSLDPRQCCQNSRQSGVVKHAGVERAASQPAYQAAYQATPQHCW